MADELFPEPTPEAQPFDPHAVGDAVSRSVESNEARRKEWREAGLLPDDEQTEPSVREETVGRIPSPKEMRLQRVERARQALRDAEAPSAETISDKPSSDSDHEWQLTDQQREAGRRGVEDARQQLP